MSKMSLEYLIGLSTLHGKTFQSTIQRLVDTLPVDKKPVQFVYNDAGELVDVRDYVKSMNEPEPKPIGFLQ